jgi:hypothetical protein
MDLSIQELKNSIIEEVTLKNYKLLQYVEKEMNQMKEEIKLLKDENKLLKINENKLITNDTIVIGCNNSAEIVLSNIITLNQYYNSCNDLGHFINNCIKCNIFMTKKVFKHFNKLNKFKTFSIDSIMVHNNDFQLIDENLVRIQFMDYRLRCNPSEYEKVINTLCTDVKYNHMKQNWKNLLDILDECNIELTINNPILNINLRDLIQS